MTMMNHKIKYFMKNHKYQKIRIIIFLLLSFVVVISIIALLIKPAVSMTGDLTCLLEEHIHNDECYSYVLVCGQNESDAHYHDESCFETKAVLICKSDDASHVHDSSCYEEKNVLICNKTEGEGHTHTDECWQRELICTKPEHAHSNKCYSGKVQADASSGVLNPEIDVDDSDLTYMNNDLSGQNIAYYSGTEIDTSVSVNFSKNISSISYTETSSSITEEDTKPVKFTLNYSLPPNTLMQVNDNKQIYYKLPDNVIVTEEQTGPVKESGKQTGTYRITTDGYIIIDFFANYVMDGTNEIAGDIMFNANVKRTDKASDKETVTMGNASVDVDFTAVKKSDLSVKKTNSGYDAASKTIDYNINISTINGSGESTINITDYLVNADQSLIRLDLTDGQTISIEKKKADGTSETLSAQVGISDDGKMTLNGLPALNAGESYSVSYSAIVTPGSKAVDFTAQNAVTVKADKLTSTDKNYVDVVTGCVLKKSGSYNERTNRIKWNISILNPFGQDINGYSVTDQMLSQAIDGTLKVLDKNNNIVENAGIFSADENKFTFGSLTGSEYRLVYETTPSKHSEENVNSAELKDSSNELVNNDTGKAYVGSERLNINKTNSSGGYSSDENAVIKWRVDLQYYQGKFANVEYNDSMSSDESEHYMTAEQFNSISLLGVRADWSEISLTKDTDYTITAFDQDSNEITDFSAENIKIYSYRIRFAENDTIQSLADVRIEYSSIGVIGSMAVGEQLTFKNHAEFQGVEKDSVYKEIKNDSIKKYDAIGGTTSDSTHRVTDLEKTENGEYILKWYIIANESNNYGSSDAVLTDTLPEGTSLIGSSVKFQLHNGSSFADSDGMTYTLSGDPGNQQVIFSVPANVHNGKKFKISYSVSVSEDYIRTHKSGQATPFKNIVSDGTETKSQTQNITSALISKSGSDPANTYDGDIVYTLDVNPYAEQLSDTGKITVKDRLLNYTQKNADGTFMYPWGFTASLLSLEVYNADTGEQLLPSQYKLSHYEEEAGLVYSVLLLELPDKMHIKIEYVYHLSLNDATYNSGYVNSYGGAVENYAEIDFSIGTDKTTHRQNYQLNKESSAHTVTSDYIKIRKTDSENFAVRLGGARFQLYQWSNDVWKPLTAQQKNEDGSISALWGNENDVPLDLVTNDNNGEYMLPELSKKVLYKLVEAQAPDGYMPRRYPYYFIFSSYPEQLPSGIQASDVNVLLKGGFIEIGNNKLSDASVTVNKHWADGTSQQPIEVQLYKSASQSEAPKTINVNISDKHGNSLEKRYKVNENSNITLAVNALNAFIKNGGTIKVNGVNASFNENVIFENHNWDSSAENGVAVLDMTYKIGSVAGNTTIDIYFDDCQTYSKYDISITNCTEISKSTVLGVDIPDDAVLVENSSVILSPDNNWTYTWTGLSQGESDGTLYYYYVKELTDIKGYTAEFDTNGINGGEVNLTNRKEAEKPTLPATGGNGVQGMMIMGALIMIIPVSCYYLFNRRKGKS